MEAIVRVRSNASAHAASHSKAASRCMLAHFSIPNMFSTNHKAPTTPTKQHQNKDAPADPVGLTSIQDGTTHNTTITAHDANLLRTSRITTGNTNTPTTTSTATDTGTHRNTPPEVRPAAPNTTPNPEANKKDKTTNQDPGRAFPSSYRPNRIRTTSPESTANKRG